MQSSSVFMLRKCQSTDRLAHILYCFHCLFVTENQYNQPRSDYQRCLWTCKVSINWERNQI